MHRDGIYVNLKLRDSDATVSEHVNQHAPKTKGSGCYIVSRMISQPPGTGFQVDIKFPEEFLRLHNLMVVVTCGAPEGSIAEQKNYQSWYIPANSPCLTYHFESFDVWEDDTSAPREVEMTVPPPDDCSASDMSDVLWARETSANRGCVTVSILRGHLQLNRQPKDRSLTEPPSIPIDLTGPAVINPDWFVRTSRGSVPPYAFEFRNMSREKLKEFQTPRKPPVAFPHSLERARGRGAEATSRFSRFDQTGKRGPLHDDDEPPSKKRTRRSRARNADSSNNSQEMASSSTLARLNASQEPHNETDHEEVLRPSIKREREPSRENSVEMHDQTFASSSTKSLEQDKRALPSNVIDLTTDNSTTAPSETGHKSDHVSGYYGDRTRKDDSTTDEIEDPEMLRMQLREVQLQMRLHKMERKESTKSKA